MCINKKDPYYYFNNRERQAIIQQVELAFNADVQLIQLEEPEFEENFAHRHREREERRNAVDRENEMIFRLQRQQPNRPLPIDEIFDIDINNNQNDIQTEQNTISEAEVDAYWMRRIRHYQQRQREIDEYNNHLQPQPNQPIPFEVIDSLDVDENNNVAD